MASTVIDATALHESLPRPSTPLRNSPKSAGNSKREHVITRVYGPGNAHARKHIAELENRMERFQTGLPNPDHVIEYENHPFDPSRRGLQDTTEDSYQPIRIYFETEALDNQRDESNADKIDFIKREILPRTGDFWSQALGVVPVSGNLFISTSELDGRIYCGDSEFTEVPADHISNGVSNTDLVLYVSGTPSSRFCSGSTLAVAVACNFDQYDRPIAGAVNFCLNQIEVDDNGSASESIIQDNVDVAIHEAGHVLGMSSNSYRFFWDVETGEPRTPRPFTTSTVTCVDGTVRSLLMPSEDTMQFFLAENGQRYASIVTPKTRAVVRNQFNCQSLAGAQLENQPTGSQSCTGDHWDERLFYPEALSGVISPSTNVLSHLTLALMEDTGWYKANYTQGKGNPWGLNAGCDFVRETCLTPGSTPEIPSYGKGYFCNEVSLRGCSPELTHKMACTVVDYDYILPRVLPDSQFQYFSSAPTKGGPRQADYCPVYGSTYRALDAEQLDCTNPENKNSILDSIDVYKEDYGPDSKCIETTTGEGRCYETACVRDEMKLKLNIGGKWYTCNSDFETISVTFASGLIVADVTCPRLSSACPDLFCPFNCAGRGVCNYGNTVNGTIVPKCECFDSTDTSAGCSDSQIPDGGFLADSSGLFDNVEENFFDPLVAVFVDHPDRWKTASWAWAAGLMALFLVMLLCICSSFWPGPKKQVSGRVETTYA